jgi:hypothetical protein
MHLLMVYLTTLSIYQTIASQGKNAEGNVSDLIEATIPEFVCRD